MVSQKFFPQPTADLILEAKKQWERNMSRTAPKFARMYELFGTGQNFSAISRQLTCELGRKVRENTVARYYHMYFRELFGGMDGNQRLLIRHDAYSNIDREVKRILAVAPYKPIGLLKDLVPILPMLPENHPLVQDARAHWEKEIPQNHPDFSEIYLIFATHLSLSEIALALGLTGKAVAHVWYNTFFAKLFGMTGEERAERVRSVREKIAEDKKQLVEYHERRRKQAELLKDPAVMDIICIGQNLGFTIDPKLTAPDGSEIDKITSLVINSHSCHLRRVTSFWKRGLKHFRVELSKKMIRRFDILLCYIQINGYPTRIFIVPCSELMSKVFNDSLEEKAIYIPVGRPRHSQARIDYTTYESTWQYLE